MNWIGLRENLQEEATLDGTNHGFLENFLQNHESIDSN